MDDIKEIKLTFKKILGSSLEAIIFELSDKINSESPLFDELILCQSRYSQISKDFHLNVVEKANRDLTLDKIRASILNLINNISIDSLDIEKLEQFRDTKKKASNLTEKDELKNNLKEILDELGYSIKTAVEEKTINLENTVRNQLNYLLSKMEVAEIKSNSNEDGNWHLTMAEAFMAKREWETAAFHFERASPYFFDNWELYFSKSIAYANSRKGRDSDFNALKAYNDTITFLPIDIDTNFKARIFIYRGAMYKRLKRLDEAEADITLGLKYAQSRYEIEDAHYNFACIYAMRGDKEKMIYNISQLGKRYRDAVKNHLNDYFSTFKDDRDLIRQIS